MREGLETARTAVVEFEEIGVHVLLLEEHFGHLVIGSRVGVSGVVIAPADVGVDEHVGGFSFDGQVVDPEVHFLHGLKSCFIGPPHVNGGGIHQHSPGAVVQLEAPAAGIVNLLDELPVSGCHILDEFLIIGIETAGVFQRERHHHLGQELGRCRDGELGFSLGAGEFLDKAEMVDEGMLLPQRQLSGEESIVNHGLFVVERQAGLGGRVAYAVEAPHEVQVPGLAAEFSVGNHLETKRFLLGYEVAYGLVFNGFEFLCGDGAGGVLDAGFLEVCGAEETADKVGAHGGESVHIHVLLFLLTKIAKVFEMSRCLAGFGRRCNCP